MSDPDVIADDDRVCAAALEEAMVALDPGHIVFRAIGETMQGRAVHRVIGRADPHVRRDGAEFADDGIGNTAAATDVREVTEGRILQIARPQDLTALSDGEVPS